MKAVALVLLLAACSSCERPTPPPLPPPESPGTCETARDTLARLGGCNMPLDRFVADCHDAEKAERGIGRRLPVGCITAADSCTAALACR